MSKFACLLARGLTPVRDATSGFFLMRRDRARGVTISAGGFKICLELLIRSEPALVIEVPYVFTGRTAGESKMNWKKRRIPRQLQDLHAYRRRRHCHARHAVRRLRGLDPRSPAARGADDLVRTLAPNACAAQSTENRRLVGHPHHVRRAAGYTTGA